MVRQVHLIAVVGTFLICCAVLLVVGCAGTRSESSNKKEKARSPKATASEEARCEGTRTYQREGMLGGSRVDSVVLTTNDLPDCPHGGLLLGTDKPDKLAGEEGTTRYAVLALMTSSTEARAATSSTGTRAVTRSCLPEARAMTLSTAGRAQTT